jgi:hypothetical protein
MTLRIAMVLSHLVPGPIRHAILYEAAMKLEDHPEVSTWLVEEAWKRSTR